MRAARPGATRVVLVTGASSGIGLACAARLLADGHRVFGASRSMPTAALPPSCARLERLAMDVTDEGSVVRAVAAVVEAAGRIDVLVGAAGYGLAGAVEETSVEEARQQLDVNFLGCVRAARAVLPVMRRQGSGLIVNVGSLAGRLGIPFQSLYCASKFALEGWSEALRAEVAHLGVRVTLVEPGDVRTAFTRNRVRARGSAGGPWGAAFARSPSVMEADEQGGPGPEVVAATVARIVRSRAPRLRHPAGSLLQRAAVALGRWLPAGWMEWAVRRYYRVEAAARGRTER